MKHLVNVYTGKKMEPRSRFSKDESLEKNCLFGYGTLYVYNLDSLLPFKFKPKISNNSSDVYNILFHNEEFVLIGRATTTIFKSLDDLENYEL